MTITTTAAVCLSLGIAGTVTFSRAADTKLTARDVLVYEGGWFDQGTAASPIPAAHTCELVFADVALAGDTGSYGNGLLVLGRRTAFGTSKSKFLRTSVAPVATDTSLSLASAPTGWAAGDLLVVPKTTQGGSGDNPVLTGTEEVTLSSVAGSTANIGAGLTYDHTGSAVGGFLPHIANLTCNVKVRSANPNGVRGHVQYLHRADVHVEFTEYLDLGRTFNNAAGQIGRYAVHFHHCFGPASIPSNGFQFTFNNNSVWYSTADHHRRWGITLHDSHYGSVQGNVVYNSAGWGIGTEDASESYNVFDGNFVVKCRGNGDRDNGGNEGKGFYFAGVNNYVRNNVAADCFSYDYPEAAYGFGYFCRFRDYVFIPNFHGADPDVDGTQTWHANLPILEYDNNEAYGCQSGMTTWWINNYGNTMPGGGATSYLDNFTCWSIYHQAYYIYEVNKVTLRNFKAYNGNGWTGTNGTFEGDYYARLFVIDNADIRGFERGINRPTTMTGGEFPYVIQNSYFNCTIADIEIGTPYTSGPNGTDILSRTIEIRNCLCEGTSKLQMAGGIPEVGNLISLDQVLLYDWDQIPGNDYQVYYTQQAADQILPQTTYNEDLTVKRVGSPDSGLTNQQNWDAHGIARGGAIAPAGATTPAWTNGLVVSF